ncbi:hypothetical protein [Streptomyces gobiensis]|uniref:hypothetical protein n=1 Tax=Streptomyces gobiensis TaxID=2875706 RepID=UPI001E4FF583|nr:hypothetical protein [Streptomyces gobiensis]UGY93157.1 hypothetical protein test1122_16515 [Streptomyces gobiensis]
MTAALMWEARAVEGRGHELLEWTRTQHLVPAPIRRETFTGPDDRVLVVTLWHASNDADLPEIPDPPPDLLHRPVHRWRFEKV